MFENSIMVGYKKTMEINPEDVIMEEELRKRADVDKNKSMKDSVMRLSEAALLSSGFSLNEPNTLYGDANVGMTALEEADDDAKGSKMEINPDDMIMEEEVRKRSNADKNNTSTKDSVMRLFETALLTSGFSLNEPNTLDGDADVGMPAFEEVDDDAKGSKMEINPDDVIMEELRKRSNADKNNTSTKDSVMRLSETALLTSGFSLNEPNTLNGNDDVGMSALEADAEGSKMEEVD